MAVADNNDAPPLPVPGERPTVFADRMGVWHVGRQTKQRRRQLGLYCTPVAVADFMARKIATSAARPRILDPAAGAGVLCCAAVEALVARPRKPRCVELMAHEVDAEVVGPLRAVLAHLTAWARSHGVQVRASVHTEDFIVAHRGTLPGNGELLASASSAVPSGFDVVIANPPYFKINNADARAVAFPDLVHGQTNIYALFMAVAAALLRQGGEFVFITPRSFASGPYFRRFRTAFFHMAQPTQLHAFGSRRAAFSRDRVLQENVILTGVRRDGWSASAATPLVVSSSAGVQDMEPANSRTVPLGTALDLRTTDKVLRLPLRDEDEAAVQLVDSWSNNLHAMGLNISTGPVVPFRATSHIAKTGKVPSTHVPLLWMHHVRPLRTTWPLARHPRGHKPEYIARASAGRLLLANKNYVLLRRFSAKEEPRRLTAAPYLAANFRNPAVGIENHVNYVHRPGGELTEEETWGLAALYSSRLLDTYFRTANGNTQVSATELRAMPLPPHDAIVALGEQVRSLANPTQAVAHLIHFNGDRSLRPRVEP